MRSRCKNLRKAAKSGKLPTMLSGVQIMPVALNLSAELIELTKPYALATHRSVPKQIEYWARLGKAFEDNPDLPPQFIKDTLLALQEAKAGQLAEYHKGAV
jgi:NaMN:DMB phosphoribosyltransferase